MVRSDARPAFGLRQRWVWWPLLAWAACLLMGCGGSYEYRLPKSGAASPAAAPGRELVAAGEVSTTEGGPDRTKDEAAGGVPVDAEKKTADATRPTPVPQVPPAAGQPPTPGAPGPKPQMATDAAPFAQVLIYTANLTMAVYEVDKALASVEALSLQMGGFLSRRGDHDITIRVPAGRFFEVMKKLEASGDVLHRDVHVEDVTDQVVDLQLRLKNAREVRDRIAQLLASAKTVEDSLKVERELERLSSEVERMEGRLKLLRERAQYSTITVTFQPLQVEELRRDRIFRLPFSWLSELGLGRLMNLQ